MVSFSNSIANALNNVSALNADVLTSMSCDQKETIFSVLCKEMIFSINAHKGRFLCEIAEEARAAKKEEKKLAKVEAGESIRAKSGGEISRISGEFYVGGQFLPQSIDFISNQKSVKKSGVKQLMLLSDAISKNYNHSKSFIYSYAKDLKSAKLAHSASGFGNRSDYSMFMDGIEGFNGLEVCYVYNCRDCDIR